MFISYKAQLINEYHTLKALFLESASQGDDNQAAELMRRMQDLAVKIDAEETPQ